MFLEHGIFFTDESLNLALGRQTCVTCHLAFFGLATREFSTASGLGDPKKEQLDLGQADGQVVPAASEAM